MDVKSPPQLPVFIAIVSAIAMLGGIIALAVIPILIIFRDQTTKMGGFVASGWQVAPLGIVVLSLFIGGGVAGLALVMEWRWGRPMVVAGWIVLTGSYIVESRALVDLVAAVEVAVLGSFAWWYFYRKRSVVGYFEALAEWEQRRLASDQASGSLGGLSTGSESDR